jgi:NAD(P)-dependent dehydrogenase (short-subunit alcohol dehydrogenase family)
MPDRQSLKDKVAVVTGGNRGIGFAIARALCNESCRVIIAGRDPKRLDAAKAELQRTGGEISGVQCDVSDSAQVEKLFASVQARYSTVDILVNNAGIAHSRQPAEKFSIDTWKQVIDTNLTGMFLCTRAALPLMQPGGTIVNNISVAAVQPFEGMAAYNASKAGALGFTNVLREELRKRGIRVLALLPGPTDSEIWNQFWPEAPHEKMMSADTVAQAVLHVVTLPAKSSIEEIRLRPTVGTL